MGNNIEKKEIVTNTMDFNSLKIIDIINAILSKHNCPDEIKKCVGIVIDEIGENIVSYAYGDNNGDITIVCECSDNLVSLTFIDNGVKFNPLDDNINANDNSIISGYGLYFVKNIADRCEYRYENNQNIFKIVKTWSK